jgi:protein-S-isoprenylcysteine O-methyltransferase Ste14
MGIKVSLQSVSAKYDGIEALSVDKELFVDKEPLADKVSLADKEPEGCHSIFCWSVKVCCCTILIASLFICTLYELQPWFVPPRLLAQTFIVVGGLSAVFHYLKLESYSCRFAQPDTLVMDQGLYRYIRHPMYLSDCLICSGLFLLFPTIPTTMVLVMGVVALIRQSKEEDRYLAERFKQQFIDWRNHTKLIIPFVY